MSMSFEVYLPELNSDTLKAALSLLEQNGISMEIDPGFDFVNSHDCGYMPIALKVSSLPGWIHAERNIETGFEIDEEEVDIADENDDCRYKRRLVVYLSLSSPAGTFIAACFGAALAEAGNGIIIDGESGLRLSNPLKETIPSLDEIEEINNMEISEAETFSGW